jgi:AGCS family alanine or glycine:cation symporter
LNATTIIQNIDNVIWATPLIILTFFGALIYCFVIKFSNVTKMGLQWKLLTSGEGSQEGISPFETFCTVVAYRVAVGNIGGVMVAIMFGGPGAILWMIITALVTSAIAYAENSLGQIYKVRMDGQYRGGPYFYMEHGFKKKKVGKIFAILFALLASIAVPFLVTGPSASNIAMAFKNSFGVSPVITGAVVAVLLMLVIAGGVRRIASFSTIIVPFMTIGYAIITIIVLVSHASSIPGTLGLIISSAFTKTAVSGGMIGGAFSYGVKRAVNSSGSGFGETPASAAAAECAHPASQGLVNAFSVYIDVIVCFCSGIMAVISNCYNVLIPGTKVFNGKLSQYIHIGTGSAVMKAQAASGTAGVVWVQEGANTAWPVVGGAIIAIALTCFAFSTCIAYYYEGESGIAYLFRHLPEKNRMKFIWGVRIVMPIMFFVWANVSASTVWAISEIAFGCMAWLNLIALMVEIPVVKKVYDDYMAQRKAGVEEPYFNPRKLGIKNCDVWMEINKARIEADAGGPAEAVIQADAGGGEQAESELLTE